VVIDNFNGFGTRCGPAKTKPPLVIDAKAVLTGAVAVQRFESIARRHLQVSQANSNLQLSQLALCDHDHVDEAPHPDPSLIAFRPGMLAPCSVAGSA